MKILDKVKLKDICELKKGKTGIKNSKPGQYPLVITAENRLTSEYYEFDTPAVCIPLVSSTGHGHASINRIHYQEGKFALGSILAAAFPKSKLINIKYLYYYLSVFKNEVLVPLMKGGANVALTISKLGEAEIIIPASKTQKKIVQIGDLLHKLSIKISKQKLLLQTYNKSYNLYFTSSLAGSAKEVSLNELFSIEKGTLQSSKNKQGKVDFITAGADWKKHTEYTHDTEAIIFAAAASGSLGRVHYVHGKFIASDLCFILVPKKEYKNLINLKFYYYYLNSNKEEIVKDLASGGAKIAINLKNFGRYKVTVCSLEKQLAYINTMQMLSLISEKLKFYEKNQLEFFSSVLKKMLGSTVK